MLVTDIEISHYSYDAHRARHSANVAMTCRDRVVSLFCQLDLPAEESPRTRAQAFVKDAIRQLRRMPEYRNGRTPLQFADHLLGETA